MSAPIPPPLTDILVGRGPFPFTIQDVVDVPASLPLGHYVLSWRWDAEQTKQVWSHCSDIEVVDAAAPAAQATTKLATTYSDRTPCVGTFVFCVNLTYVALSYLLTVFVFVSFSLFVFRSLSSK